jgi:hypothetical protein
VAYVTLHCKCGGARLASLGVLLGVSAALEAKWFGRGRNSVDEEIFIVGQGDALVAINVDACPHRHEASMPSAAARLEASMR